MKPSTTMKTMKKTATSIASGGLCLIDKIINHQRIWHHIPKQKSLKQ